jgi:hypothetical protein
MCVYRTAKYVLVQAAVGFVGQGLKLATTTLAREQTTAVSQSNRQQYLQQAVRQNAARTATRAAPVSVMTNGRVERQCMNLGQVVNHVLQQYSHVPELQALFGDRVVVAYRNPPSLRKLLVKAKH